MATEPENIRLDLTWIRPQEREREGLSGQVVNFRSHNGTGISFRGKQYMPNKEGLVRDVPIEAIRTMEDMVFTGFDGKQFRQKFDIVK